MNSLADIRDRIHSKAENYFTLEYRKRDPKDWRMFYGATDALLDASMAASAYDKAVKSDPAVDLLVCYGFLQALYIQQDAVWTLSRSIGLDWHPNNDPKIREIRDLRNRLTGHPAFAEKSRQLSSAIIEYHGVSSSDFSGHIYFDTSTKRVTVHVQTILKDNESQLAIQMLKIEAAMDEQERKFRSEQSKKPFSDLFGTGFDYLMQRLRPELDDEGRVVQASTHVTMIRDRINALRQELTDRGLESQAFTHELSAIIDGLKLIDKMIANSDRSATSQNEIDIVCDGFGVNMNKLRERITELDKKLNTSIP
ncbi:MAG TPA: hypothetical protein VFA57_00800 [Pseudolabrys sp.]|nr:hypothetical protein [Pseudolabrys sp.]